MNTKNHQDLRKGTREALSLIIAFYEAKKRDHKSFTPKDDGFRFNELARFVHDEKELGTMEFER